MQLTKAKYEELKASGMFWEIYPHLTGDYECDKPDLCSLSNITNFRLLARKNKSHEPQDQSKPNPNPCD